MRESDRTKIAGSRTCGDWREFRDKLVPGGDLEGWDAAFSDYFWARINLRYLEPISLIQNHDTKQGEGFSIVAIHCTLVEFLEATMQGKNYRYLRKGAQPSDVEYSKSGPVFVNFLSKRQPFANAFDEPLAQDFYEHVRCGLLHEARTTNGWLIRADDQTDAIVQAKDPKRKILIRNNFHKALLDFIEWYKGELATEPDVQKAFLRKFDSLCD